MQEKVLEPELLNPYAVADYYDTVDLTMYLKSKEVISDSSTDTLLIPKLPTMTNMDKLKSMLHKPNHVSQLLLTEKGPLFFTKNNENENIA